MTAGKAAAAWVATHRKLLVVAGGALVTVAVQAFGTNNPWVSLAVLAATSFGVYQAPNARPAAPLPPGTYGGTTRVVVQPPPPSPAGPAPGAVVTPQPPAAASPPAGPIP